MEGDRCERALARIAAAVGRIESAASKPRSGTDSAEVTMLRSRHDRLRAAVTQSLAELDTLIGSPGGER
jgi:hypothetical protein